MIVFISDFDLRGSGYMNIATSLCNELATRHGRRVTALGMGYDGSEHNWPFQLLPVPHAQVLQNVPAMLHNFRAMAGENQWYQVDAVVVALDIPYQEKMLQIDRGGIPYVGIFPIESGPLCASWGASLSFMTERLVISEFGERMITNTGQDATYLPVGIDTESWRVPSAEERAAIRKSLGFEDNEFVVLTVADNQERKNLSIGAELISLARKKIDAKWVVVTRTDSPVGWKLDDLAAKYDITEAFTKFNRGLPFSRLWYLYAAADAFLLTSKAEGLCMPILEAMACGTPVLATNCTAIPEHAYADPDWSRIKQDSGSWIGKGKPVGPRGLTIPVEYVTIDPWGNSERSFASAKAGANILIKMATGKIKNLEQMKQAGIAYAKSRTWAQAGDVVEQAIKDAISSTQEALGPQSGIMPESLPTPVPEFYIPQAPQQEAADE